MFSGFTRSGMVRTALTGLVAILYNESVNYLISRKSYVEAEFNHVAVRRGVVQMASYWRGVAPNAVSMQDLASILARARTAGPTRFVRTPASLGYDRRPRSLYCPPPRL